MRNGSPKARLVCLAALLAGLSASVSCDSRSTANTPALESSAISGNGIVQGRVMLLGQPPAPEFIPNEPCHDGSGPIEQDRLVVNGDGSLRNVLVWLEGLPRTTGAHRPPALLDQKNCQYVPHVLGVQIQQKLVIRSSDPTLHNVHYAPEQNQSANFGFVGEGVERQTSFERAEIIHTRCNVHPWMHAYVGVFDNAFFAVTGDGGTYHIAGVPAGTYTLVAWHEQLGRREQTIVVPQDASPPAVEASFEFRI